MKIHLTHGYDPAPLHEVLLQAGLDKIETTLDTSGGWSIEVPDQSWLALVRSVDPGARTCSG